VVGPLVSVEELGAALRGAEPPVLLDVRWSVAGGPDRDGYLEGHLPGAVFVDLDRDLAGPPGRGGRHPLPDPVAFQAAMRRAGVRAGREVVAYDDGELAPAARAWWLLAYHGHQRARVLDGGLRAWTAAGLPLDRAVPAPAEGDFVARPGGRPLLDADGAAGVARTGVLLDARTEVRFRGEQEPVDPVAGHVPGARSAPAAQLFGPDGRLRPAEELRAYFERLGAAPGVPVGAYCGSGVTAAGAVLALEVAGVPAALYAGSWSEWITDPDRPVAVGAEERGQRG
jgi:thiosulfate/3-mercaptopyruvate sulfurtransferase